LDWGPLRLGDPFGTSRSTSERLREQLDELFLCPSHLMAPMQQRAKFLGASAPAMVGDERGADTLQLTAAPADK
jgi:hypothetical protein